MPERSGLTLSQAIQKLLENLGMDVPPSVLKASLGPDPSLDDSSRELTCRGFLARWCELDTNDLGYLNLPTLLAMPEGGFAVLRERSVMGVRLESTPNEIEFIPLTRFKREFQGCSTLLISKALETGGLWRQVLQRLMAFMQEGRKVAFAGVLLQVFALTTPFLMQTLVDMVFPQGSSSLFVVVIITMLVVAGYQAWIKWIQARILLYIESRLIFELEIGFFSHLLHLPFRWLCGRSLGELSQGVYALQGTKLLSEVVLTAITSTIALTYLICMALILPLQTLLLGLAGALYGTWIVLVGHRLMKRQTQVVDFQEKERGFMVELLQGIPTIKASGTESQMEREWGQCFAQRRLAELIVQREYLLGHSTLSFLLGATLQFILLWCAYLALRSDITLGGMLSFTIMATNFVVSIDEIANIYLRWMIFKTGLRETMMVLAQKPLGASPRPADNTLSGPISMEGLWFRYQETGPWILHNLNMEILPKEKLLIRGPSGCGKSTLLKLMAGLYEPDRGTISYAGKPPHQSKNQVAYLPQFVQIFQGSIRKNMSLLSGGASMRRLMEASEQTGLGEFVQTLPMGFETLLTSGGGNLSGGQRQLVALTALLASQKTVLLMDEALANLDSLWKGRLFQCPLFADKTVVFVSHDDGTAMWQREAQNFRQVQF